MMKRAKECAFVQEVISGGYKSQCLIPKCLIVSVRHHENQVRVMTFEAY